MGCDENTRVILGRCQNDRVVTQRASRNRRTRWAILACGFELCVKMGSGFMGLLGRSIWVGVGVPFIWVGGVGIFDPGRSGYFVRVQRV